jgi:hypothetical protein
VSLISVAFDGRKLFEWEGNAETLVQINQETTRIAKVAQTSQKALWQSTLVGIKQNGGSYFSPRPESEMMVVTWGLMALPTHHSAHPGVFGDYLDQWGFDFNIKIDPESDKKFIVEVTGGFDRDAREARAAIKSFSELLTGEQTPRATTPKSVLDPKELLTKIDGGQESQPTWSGEFDSYRSLADSNVRIIVAKEVVPPFRFNAGGWELSQPSIDPGPAIRARIAQKGFFMFRESEDQSGGVELASLPPRRTTLEPGGPPLEGAP